MSQHLEAATNVLAPPVANEKDNKVQGGISTDATPRKRAVNPAMKEHRDAADDGEDGLAERLARLRGYDDEFPLDAGKSLANGQRQNSEPKPDAMLQVSTKRRSGVISHDPKKQVPKCRNAKKKLTDAERNEQRIRSKKIQGGKQHCDLVQQAIQHEADKAQGEAIAKAEKEQEKAEESQKAAATIVDEPEKEPQRDAKWQSNTGTMTFNLRGGVCTVHKVVIVLLLLCWVLRILPTHELGLKTVQALGWYLFVGKMVMLAAFSASFLSGRTLNSVLITLKSHGNSYHGFDAVIGEFNHIVRERASGFVDKRHVQTRGLDILFDDMLIKEYKKENVSDVQEIGTKLGICGIYLFGYLLGGFGLEEFLFGALLFYAGFATRKLNFLQEDQVNHGVYSLELFVHIMSTTVLGVWDSDETIKARIERNASNFPQLNADRYVYAEHPNLFRDTAKLAFEYQKYCRTRRSAMADF